MRPPLAPRLGKRALLPRPADDALQSATREQRSTSRGLFRTLILFLVSSAIITATYLLFSQPEDFSWTDLLSLQLIAVTAALISTHLLQDDGSLKIDIKDPASFYGIFYFVYHLLPYILLVTTAQISERNSPIIAALFLVGYGAFYLGTRLVKAKPVAESPQMEFPAAHTLVMLILCFGGIVLIVSRYVIRTSEGLFYNQARSVLVDATLGDSIFEVFAQSLQFPIVLLLGLLSLTQHQALATLARRVFWAYSVGMFMIFVLTSQTRPAVTVLIFVVAFLQFAGKLKFRKRYFAFALAGVLIVVGLIQGVRVSSGTAFARSENQFLYAIQNTFENGILGVTSNQNRVVDRLVGRSSAGSVFLSEIIDATSAQQSYLLGQGVFTSLVTTVVPRFIWADKPVALNGNLIVRQLLGLSMTDGTLTPTNQFYAEGGWFVIVVGYLLFGFLMSQLGNITFLSNKVGAWLVFCFMWSHVVEIERELIVGTILTLRDVLLIWLLYRALVLVLPTAKIRTTRAVDVGLKRREA